MPKRALADPKLLRYDAERDGPAGVVRQELLAQKALEAGKAVMADPVIFNGQVAKLWKLFESGEVADFFSDWKPGFRAMLEMVQVWQEQDSPIEDVARYLFYLCASKLIVRMVALEDGEAMKLMDTLGAFLKKEQSRKEATAPPMVFNFGVKLG